MSIVYVANEFLALLSQWGFEAHLWWSKIFIQHLNHHHLLRKLSAVSYHLPAKNLYAQVWLGQRLQTTKKVLIETNFFFL